MNSICEQPCRKKGELLSKVQCSASIVRSDSNSVSKNLIEKEKFSEQLDVLRCGVWMLAFPLLSSVSIEGGDVLKRQKISLFWRNVLVYVPACRNKFSVFWYLVLNVVYVSRQTGLFALSDGRSSVAAEYLLSFQFCKFYFFLV